MQQQKLAQGFADVEPLQLSCSPKTNQLLPELSRSCPLVASIGKLALGPFCTGAWVVSSMLPALIGFASHYKAY